MAFLKKAEKRAVKKMSVDIKNPPLRPINSFISQKNIIL
jgi:hypothetical protein